jgi:hypothetical protein
MCFRGLGTALEDADANVVVLSPSRVLPPSSALLLPKEVSSRAPCFQAANQPGRPLPQVPTEAFALAREVFDEMGQLICLISLVDHGGHQ